MKKRRRQVQAEQSLTRVPREEDWGDYNADLDQKHAHSAFAGRTNEQMQPFFRRNPIEMSEDLRWMPQVPFRYYMLGFRDAIVTRKFETDYAASAASCFVELVLERLQRQPIYILPIMPELLTALEFVANNQALFDANESIYGSFMERLARIRELSEHLGQR